MSDRGRQPSYRGRPIGPASEKNPPPGEVDPDLVKAALKKLKEYHDAGRISDAEYARKKADLLGRL